MKKYTKTYLIERLKESYNKKGKKPACLNLGKKNDMPDRSVFENRFGSFNSALIQSGLNINKTYRKWTKEEIIKWLQYKYNELGKTPGIRDFDKDPKTPGKNTVKKLFGSWTNALRKAKIPIKRFRSEKELIEIIKKLAKKLNKTPTRTDMNNAKGFPSYIPFVERFGSYTAACLRAGLTPNDGRNNDIWKGWQKHCEVMAKILYKNIEIQKKGIIEGVPDIYIPNEMLFIDAKTCGYKDFKEQIKRYCLDNYRVEFWLIFKGIETKRKRVTYIYAEDLARKMKKLGKEDLAIKCYQFIRNVYSDEQKIVDEFCPKII